MIRVLYTFTFKSDFSYNEATETLLKTDIPKGTIKVLGVTYKEPELILDLEVEELVYCCLLECNEVVRTASYEII